MIVQANVQLAIGDAIPESADEYAVAILEALGGDPAKDRVMVTVSMSSTGQAGPTNPLPLGPTAPGTMQSLP